MSNKRKLLILGAVLAAGSFAGGAYAATSTNASPRQAFLNDVAHRLGVSPQRLMQAFKGAEVDRLNAAVKAGRLTQAQANAIERAIGSGQPAFPLFPGVLPFKGPLLRSFKDQRLPPFKALKRQLLPRGPLFAGPLERAASYLGISRAQLLDQLAAGKSLAQIARAHGKTLQGLEKELFSPRFGPLAGGPPLPRWRGAPRQLVVPGSGPAQVPAPPGSGPAQVPAPPWAGPPPA